MTAAPRRVRIVLAYDGTAYAGWQVQPRLATVQGEVEAALARLHGGSAVVVRGAGRTDAGVHARGQVADARVSVALDDEGLLRALSRLLPADIRPRALETVPERFHARHDARVKTYTYALALDALGDPFRARYALEVRRRLDLDAVRRGLARLPGRRDWSGFAGSATPVRDPVRDLREAVLEVDGDRATLRFSADGFLNHMVRNLVGTLLEIGRGRFAPERIDDVLERRDRALAGPTAPARGLCLERVTYDG